MLSVIFFYFTAHPVTSKYFASMGAEQSTSPFANSCLSTDKFQMQQMPREVVMTPDDMRQWMHTTKLASLKTIETFEARVERYCRSLEMSVEHMQKMVESFVHELEVGLIAHKAHPHDWIPQECSFKMLDSCVDVLPTGKERGVYYAVDFGGTNFRVVRVELNGPKDMEVRQNTESFAVGSPTHALMKHPKGLLDPNTTALEMFDFFARSIHQFMEDEGDLDKGEIKSGFTFSFPCSQRCIDSAKLVSWTKGFETGRSTRDPVEGLDVAELLNVALNRFGTPLVCNAILNDTVGTLLSCSYEMDRKEHPPCLVGMILGTGMNCCYYEETANEYGYKGKIINIECGNFNRDLPRTTVDCELDFKAIDNRGFQQIEKMCSGAYLGEICRITIVKVFQDRSPALAWEYGSLTTENVATIMSDRSKELIVTSRVMADVWEVSNFSIQDLSVVHRIATQVMNRSASLAAVLIAGCAKKTGRLQPAFGGLSVGIDGSLFKRNIQYREKVRETLNAILGETTSSLIHLLLANDGSGKGAAILAAALEMKRSGG